MATSAPSSARASAMARPMPREPPVTSAVRPLSFIGSHLLSAWIASLAPGPWPGLDAECYAIHSDPRSHPVGERHGVRHQAVLEPKALRHAGESLRHPRGD